jgi:hypothetical protein
MAQESSATLTAKDIPYTKKRLFLQKTAAGDIGKPRPFL